MTIQNLLKKSGIQFTRQDAGTIGMKVMSKAREKKVKWVKKKELIEVNDYPEEFISEMQEILITHFSNKKSKK